LIVDVIANFMVCGRNKFWFSEKLQDSVDVALTRNAGCDMDCRWVVGSAIDVCVDDKYLSCCRPAERRWLLVREWVGSML